MKNATHFRKTSSGIEYYKHKFVGGKMLLRQLIDGHYLPCTYNFYKHIKAELKPISEL